MEFIKDMQDVNWRYCAFYVRWRWHRLKLIERILLFSIIIFIIYVIVQINRGMDMASEAKTSKALPHLPIKQREPLKTCPIQHDPSKELQLSDFTPHNTFAVDDIRHRYDIDHKKDTVVFFHIQKTSGVNFLVFLKTALGKALFIKDVNVRKDKSCSVHMDFARMKRCLAESQWEGERKRPLVVTMLRDPIHRYLSEWLNLSSENYWLPTVHQCSCNCKEVHIPRCLLSANIPDADLAREQLMLSNARRQIKNKLEERLLIQDATIVLKRWSSLRLTDFLNCYDNPAANRQVRMLGDADIMNEDCSNFEQLFDDIGSHKRLESAKKNLREIAFFGLAEYQSESQKLFYKTFGYDAPLNQSMEDRVSCLDITDELRDKIQRINSVDYQLYEYAKDLFFQRLKAYGII